MHSHPDLQPDPAAPRGLALHWQILIGLALGIGVGLLLNEYSPVIRTRAESIPAGQTAIDFIINLNRLMGDLFKRSLQFIATPIILFALILAVGSLGNLRTLGRLGAKTVGIFMFTAVVSVAMGLLLVNFVQPGGERFIDGPTRERLLAEINTTRATEIVSTAKSTDPWDLLRTAMPTNPFEALAKGDMLQIVVFALILGIALSLLPRERSRPVFEAVEALSDAFINIVRAIMKFAPLGVFCLMVPIVASLGFSVLMSLGAYCLTVIAGLALIQFLLYPAVVLVFSGMPLRKFFRGIAQVQMVAFSSSSSAATLPVTIQNVRDRLGVPPDIANFTCAMGAKLNMDGTAMMQAVATVFLAQFYGMKMSISQQGAIVFMAVLSAIGTPGIPSGGMVMLVIVLTRFGIPAEGIAMILAVDRILDMCRTVVNVTGDAAAAVAVAGTEAGRER